MLTTRPLRPPFAYALHLALFCMVVGLSKPAAAAVSGGGELEYPYSERELFERGELPTYAGEYLKAVSFPVGGVGAGAVHIDGNGIRHLWTIFPRYWQPVDAPYERNRPTNITHIIKGHKRVPAEDPKKLWWYSAFVPDSFFAVRTKTGENPPVVRSLQALAEGPFKPVDKLTMHGAYPLAWYNYHDDDLDAKISMRTWNPLIPMELKDSAIPCAIYDLTAENPTEEPIEVTFMATQQNAAGYEGHKRTIDGVHSGRTRKNINGIKRYGKTTLLHMTTAIPEDDVGYGDMALGTRAKDVTATAAWYEPAKLLADFRDDGDIRGPRKEGPTGDHTVNGALAQTVTLQPGETHTITFVLSWYFPNAYHGGGKMNKARLWEGRGNRYTLWWENAAAVTKDVLKRYDTLERRTKTYQESLYESNLPYWMLNRISAQLTPIRTGTVWWDRSGYFGGWEAMTFGTGHCPGNCNHVWHYAQAHARLFPALGRRLREQNYQYELPGGGLWFRQTTKPAPWPRLVEQPMDPQAYPAVDGQLGVICASYREHLTSTDDAWLRRTWPSIRKAMQFVIDTWDADGNGELNGIQHTTLDCKVAGSTSWLGSMYLAALRACEEMARTVGETDTAAEYRRLHQSGSKIQDRTLFNGEYYIQHIEGDPEELPDYYYIHGLRKKTHPAYVGGQNYYDGCLTDQLLGQWWARQLGQGWLYRREHVRTALKSLFKYNFFPDFMDEEDKVDGVPKVVPEDGGMLLCTWPKGLDERLDGQKLIGYHGTTLPGFEYAAAAAMIQAGLLKEGFTIVRTIHERYNGKLRLGLHRKTTWSFSGNPFGDEEAGKWGARAMSAWSLLLAAQGFTYDGPDGVIGFDPVWKPENHRSFFTGAEGYGVFSQQREEDRQHCTIEVRDGRLDLQRIVVHAPADVGDVDAAVASKGQAIAATVGADNGNVTISFAKPLLLTAGDAVEIALAW